MPPEEKRVTKLQTQGAQVWVKGARHQRTLAPPKTGSQALADMAKATLAPEFIT